MSEHRLIGFRETGRGRIPIVLGTGLAVREIAGIVDSEAGDVDRAAGLLGLDPRLVQAAVDYRASGKPLDEQEAPAEARGAIELATSIVGLFAGLATIIYIAGAVVLALRLAIEGLPFEPVVGQLPREFVLSVGGGQVALPAVLVGGLYAGYRLLRGSAARRPSPARFRGSPVRQLCLALAFTGLVLTPALLFGVHRREDIDDLAHWRIALAAGVICTYALSLAAFELRGVLAQRTARSGWNRIGPALAMSAVWAMLALPGLVAFWSVFPLNEAKVCTTVGFSERGLLIGQTADRIYLGEQFVDDPRISAFPIAQVEELFVGPYSSQARCDARGATAAVQALAELDRTRDLAARTQRFAAGSGADDLSQAVRATHEAGDAASRTGNTAQFFGGEAAFHLDPVAAQRARDAGEVAYSAGQAALAAADAEQPQRALLAAAARRAAGAAVAAACAMETAAMSALSRAKAEALGVNPPPFDTSETLGVCIRDFGSADDSPSSGRG